MAFEAYCEHYEKPLRLVTELEQAECQSRDYDCKTCDALGECRKDEEV